MAGKPKLTVVMDCGHAADSKTADGEVYCSACFGESILAFKPREIPNVWRWAECMDCGSYAESKPLDLAFYQYRDDKETDLFACGCKAL